MTQTLPYPASTTTETAVLQVLAYFDVFSHPLRAEEVFAFCGVQHVTQEAVSAQLQSMAARGLIAQYGSFFQFKKESAWVEQRLDCNRRADDFLPIAQRKARFIGKFPFVRGVFVSGSLSKHCMRPDSDVDFFIVTEPGRLWLARTLLVLYKKIFLLNSHKYFCINYFVDTEHLEIEEKNLFTATEAVTLLPMWGQEYYHAFCRANAWAWAAYPHFAFRSATEIPPASSGIFKRLLEKLCAGSLGQWLDQQSMRLTVGFWKRKFSHLDPATFDLALKSRRGVSKHHPLHFQQKVLERFEENLRRMEVR